jgi:hypothetical protein
MRTLRSGPYALSANARLRAAASVTGMLPGWKDSCDNHESIPRSQEIHQNEAAQANREAKDYDSRTHLEGRTHRRSSCHRHGSRRCTAYVQPASFG